MSQTGFNINNGASSAASAAAGATAAPETEFTINSGSTAANVSGSDSIFDDAFHADGLSMVNTNIEKYALAVDPLIKSAFPAIETGFITGTSTARYYVVTRADGHKVGCLTMFVAPQTKDERDIGWRRVDIRNALGQLRKLFPQIVLADMTTLLLTFDGDMNRTQQGAEEIVRTLRGKVGQLATVGASVLKNKPMGVNYDLETVRQYIASVSPHGVAPRIETGAIYETQVNTKNDVNRGPRWNPADYSADKLQRPTVIMAIGGYLEVGQPTKRQMPNGQIEERFELFYHITAAYSPFASLGMLAMAIGTYASHIVNDDGAIPQFYNKKANGDIGMLVEDEDRRGHFLETGSNDDVRAFFASMCWKPYIILDSIPGFDLFPGQNHLTNDNPEVRTGVAKYLANFFSQPDTAAFNGVISQYVGMTLEGYYGNAQGQLLDTRNYDWFKLAQTEGLSALTSQQGRLWRMLSKDDLWIGERFRSLRERLPDVIPMSERYMHVINPKWINWVAGAMRALDIRIQDTASNDGFTSSIGSIGNDFMVDSVNSATTTFGGANELGMDDVFNV